MVYILIQNLIPNIIMAGLTFNLMDVGNVDLIHVVLLIALIIAAVIAYRARSDLIDCEKED